MPTARILPAVGANGNTLYVAGGALGPNYLATLEAYDTVANTWTTLAPMPTPRMEARGIVVNGIFYVFGGLNDSGDLNTVEAYDPASNTWAERSPMPLARRPGAVVAVGGLICVIGGWTDVPWGTTANVEAYDPNSDTWTPKAPMPMSRMGFEAGIINGNIYVIGGFYTPNNGVEAYITQAYRYDPVVDQWTVMPNNTGPAAQGGAGDVLNGSLYNVDGSIGDKEAVNTVISYDPATDTYTNMPPAPTGRIYLGVATINGRLYAVGGTTHGAYASYYAVATLESFTPTLPAAVTISSTSLNFGSQFVGSTSAPETVTLTNTGGATLDFTSMAITGDFAETDACGTSLAAGANCTISVSFTPTATAARSAFLTITDNASDSPQSVSLSGTGAPAGTTTTISAPTVTYNANGTVTVTVTSTLGTVTGNVSLAVDGGAPTTQALSGGSAVFTLTSPTAGDHSLSASYAARGNFDTSSAAGALHVNKANQTITWSNPADIILGTALGTTQLNATVTVVGPAPAGALTYNPAAGTVLGAGAAQPLTVATAATNNYNSASKTVYISVRYSTGACLGDAGHQILQPINATGTMSVFKLGSTVPTKFRVCDAKGVSIGTPGVVTGYNLIAAGTNTGLAIDEDVYSTTPDTAFRWDATGQQWIFNQSTKNNPSLNQANAVYVFQISLNDGTWINFSYGLK